MKRGKSLEITGLRMKPEPVTVSWREAVTHTTAQVSAHPYIWLKVAELGPGGRFISTVRAWECQLFFHSR